MVRSIKPRLQQPLPRFEDGQMAAFVCEDEVDIVPSVEQAFAVCGRNRERVDHRSSPDFLRFKVNLDRPAHFCQSIDHMARLGVDGGTLGYCHDGASESGNGGVGTWTTDLPALAGTPIDHVLATSNWKVTGSIVLRSLDGSGSDHRPLVVQLEPAG